MVVLALSDSRAAWHTNFYERLVRLDKSSVVELRRLRQEDCKFEVSLSYLVGPYLRKEKRRREGGKKRVEQREGK